MTVTTFLLYIIASNIWSTLLLIVYFRWIKKNKEKIDNDCEDTDIKHLALFTTGSILYFAGYIFPILIVVCIAYVISEKIGRDGR